MSQENIKPTYAELVRELDELNVMYQAKREEAEYWKNLHANYVEESIYKSHDF